MPLGQQARAIIQPVSIDISPDGDLFVVSVSPPHGEQWKSPRALTAWEVARELGERGCHSTEITDALDQTEVDWRPAYDREVMGRRGDATP